MPYSKKTLTLEEILSEVEKDEIFEITQRGKGMASTNNKEFITWNEFMSYFNDFKEIEERNMKSKNLLKARQSL
jgi:hypothetical protein